jgi:hypothetical protein
MFQADLKTSIFFYQRVSREPPLKLLKVYTFQMLHMYDVLSHRIEIITLGRYIFIHVSIHVHFYKKMAKN